MKIRLNGEEREVDSPALSYESVVSMAGMKGWPSVTFARGGPGGQESGILSPGREVALWPGMVFNVCHTGNA
jgi:hypothetical protein